MGIHVPLRRDTVSVTEGDNSMHLAMNTKHQLYTAVQ